MSATVRSFRSGQMVFQEGEPSRHMYVVQKGTISIRKTKGSSFVELARAFPNQVIGEISFFDRQARSATAVAISDVELIEISFASLDDLYADVPPYFKTIMACVADRLRRASDTIRKLEKNESGAAGANEQADKPGATASILESLADVPAKPAYILSTSDS